MTIKSALLNAYVQIALGALAVTASELLMKSGASAQRGNIGVFGIAALANGRTWLGILCYCASFASWVYVLRTVPLAIAYALINVVHVLIPLGCWFFLAEAISPQRWLGIALVLAGLLLVVKPLAMAEKKLEALP
jgi:multidrug transporter EmrE-like cation transporter